MSTPLSKVSLISTERMSPGYSAKALVIADSTNTTFTCVSVTSLLFSFVHRDDGLYDDALISVSGGFLGDDKQRLRSVYLVYK